MSTHVFKDPASESARDPAIYKTSIRAKRTSLNSLELTNPNIKIFQPATGKFRDDQKVKSNSVNPSFQFINTVGPEACRSPNARSIVKSHVMRKFHQDKARNNKTAAFSNLDLENAKEPDAATLEDPEWPTFTYKFRLWPAAERRLHSRDSSIKHRNKRKWNSDDSRSHHFMINPSEISTVVNELNATNRSRSPISSPLINSSMINHYSLELVHYFIQRFVKRSIPMIESAVHHLFIQATTDSACYHGSLLIATTLRSLLRRTALSPESYYHRGEAIRLVNKSLEDAEHQTNDGMITAIVCLAIFEDWTSPLVNAGIHVEGLGKVVALRELRGQPKPAVYLQKLMQRVDLCHASANLLRPRFGIHHPLPPFPTFEDEVTLHASLNEQWGTEFPDSPVKHYDGMDHLQVSLFHRLRQLSALAPEVDKANVDSTLQHTFIDKVILFQHQVTTSIWSMEINNVRQHGSLARQQAPAAVKASARTWHTSVIIYIYLVLKELPPSTQIVKKLVARCRISLENLSPTELWCDVPPRFLFWVLVIVGAASVPELERTWARGLLVEMRDRLQIESWDVAKKMLEDYAWVESRCDKVCKAFWDESTALRPASGRLTETRS